MCKAYKVQMVVLYPLDESGLTTIVPEDAPHRAKPPMKRRPLQNWRQPLATEKEMSSSQLSGDEWLDEKGDLICRDGGGYSLTPDEAHWIYDAIWRNMDRENNLINQRISWSIMLTAGFLTAQTFVLARVVEVLSAERQVGLNDNAYFLMFGATCLCAGLSYLAAYFCQQTRAGVDAAQRQLSYLKRRYYRLRTDDKKSLFQDKMMLPRPFGNNQDHSSGNVVAQHFPKVMSTVWWIFFALEVLGAAGIIYESQVAPETMPTHVVLAVQKDGTVQLELPVNQPLTQAK